jgi:hypothetical protein
MSDFEGRLLVNATSAVISSVEKFTIPAALLNYYRVVINIRAGRGAQESPDGATVYARLIEPDGTALAGRLFEDVAGVNPLAASASLLFPVGSDWQQQDNDLGDGRFEIFVGVDHADSSQELTLEIGWAERGGANYSYFRVSVEAAVAVAASPTTAKGIFDEFPAKTDSLITQDPTFNELAAAGIATSEVIMHILTVTMPETAPAEAIYDSMFFTGHWTGEITTGAGTGSSYWMISFSAEVVGNAPSVDAVAITDAAAESPVKADHSMAGVVRSSAYAGKHGTFYLLLVGAADVALEELTATIWDDTEIEGTFHVQ